MNVTIDIPVIETERLLLREHRYTDYSAIHAMWADPAVTHYIGGKPRPEEESWLKFLRVAGLWVHLGYGYWVVEERESGAVAGEIGFADFKRDMTPSLKGEAEIGWALAAPFHGKGYAGEAVRAALAWGLEHLRDRPISCIIDPENIPSIRLAERCGFEKTAETTYASANIIVFHYPKPAAM